ncbi:MAG: CARDB domain-containing protein [Halobacteriales archaeon]|nr:CARDB domain-containing protein [Halobacteriales archaeon]
MSSGNIQGRNLNGIGEIDPYMRGAVVMTLVLAGVLFGTAVITGTATAQATAPDCSEVVYDVGDGSPANPYEVGNVEQLQCIEDNDLSASYELASDIDASGTSEWNDGDGFEPIGDRRDPESFTGTFDGNGNTIENLTIDRTDEDRVGLFDRIWNGGSVENVVLDNVTVRGDFRVGGIAGLIEGGTVENSAVNGTVAGSTSVGGIVGTLFNIEGSITQDPVRSTLSGSFSSGNVTGSTGRTGGIVGLNRGTVQGTYTTASVRSDSFVGGIVAINGNKGVVRESYAMGGVTGNDYVGGIGGQSGGDVTETYWDTEATGQQTGIGLGSGGTNVEGLTTEEMTGDEARGNMTGFDFDTTWVTTDTYPQLLWSVEDIGLDAPETLTVGETSPAPSFFNIVDGSTPSVTSLANYSSSDTDVITVSSPLEAVGVGTSTVTVERLGFVDSESVTVKQGELFNVNVTGTNSPVIEGETLEVTANVTNTGDEEGTQEVNLTDTGFSSEQQDEAELTLGPGESNDSVVLEWQTEVGDVGTGDVTVFSENDSDLENVTVGRRAESELSNLDIAGQGGDATITEGKNEVVAVRIKNLGDEDGSFDVTLEVSDNVRENRSVESLSGGGTETVAFSGVTGVLGPADYVINVSTANDTVTGNMTVQEDDCINRRSLSRGQENQGCPRDRTLGRGSSREELDRETGRSSDTSRRDRGRGSSGRGR